MTDSFPQDFLLLKELKPKIVLNSKNSQKSIGKGVTVKRLCSRLETLNGKPKKYLLKNITFNVKCGEILAVVGPVGSGKVRHSLSGSQCPIIAEPIDSCLPDFTVAVTVRRIGRPKR